MRARTYMTRKEKEECDEETGEKRKRKSQREEEET